MNCIVDIFDHIITFSKITSTLTITARKQKMCIAFAKNHTPTLPPDRCDNDHNKISRASTHSLSSDETSESIPSIIGKQGMNTKKQVRFQNAEEPEIIDTMKPSSTMTPEELAQIHWQLPDYEYFRGTARIIAHEVLKLSAKSPPSSHRYDTVLTRAHQLCSCQHGKDGNHAEELKKLSKTDIEEELKAHGDDSVCLPPNLFAALTHWTKSGHSRRGLEKFCVPHHMENRPLERQAVVQAVLIAQNLLKERRAEAAQNPSKLNGKFRIGTWEFSLDLADDEILRVISQRFTRTSRKFATTMGHADAAAVGNYEHNQGK